MKAIGVTCGIGSMLIGARQAGFDVVGNIDWRKYYHAKDAKGRNTFTENFPNAFFVHNYENLLNLSKKEFPSIDLAMGHPECGNYSIMNQSRQKKECNPGDIPLFAELIQIIKPRFFVQDNLPRSLLGYTIQQWHGMLPQYDLFPEWISNYNYGNIQKSRNRLFIIGALSSERFVFVPEERKNTKTAEDFLRKIPKQGHVKQDPNKLTHFNSYKDGHKMTYKEVAEIFKDPDRVMIDIKHIKKDLSVHKKFNYGKVWNPPYLKKNGILGKKIGYCILYKDHPAFTLTGGENLFHYLTGFPLTCRERARIQGCPDNFKFYLKDMCGNEMTKQTGKFMPVQFCTYISKQIATHIKKKKFRSSGNRLIKPNKYVDEAKIWYCKNVGYNHQKQVCEACWLECKK